MAGIVSTLKGVLSKALKSVSDNYLEWEMPVLILGEGAGAYRISGIDHFISIVQEVRVPTNENQLTDFQKLSDGGFGNKYTVSLADQFEDIELAFLRSGGVMWVKMPGSYAVLAKCIITKFEETYGPITGLQIEGVTVGCSQLEARKYRKFVDMKISDIATKIISENKDWRLGTVEPTKDVPNTNVNDGKKNREWVQQGQTDMEFLDMLAGEAVSEKTEKGPYVAVVEDDPARPKISFIPAQAKEAIKEWEFSIYDVANARSGEVISWSPDIKNMPAAITYVINEHGAPTAQTPGPSKGALEQADIAPSARRGARTAQGSDDEETKMKAQNMFNAFSISALSGTLELWGIDYTIKLMDVVRVTAYRPDGMVHYSSGKYWVMKCTNTFNMGKATQTLELRRDTTMESWKGFEKGSGKVEIEKSAGSGGEQSVTM